VSSRLTRILRDAVPEVAPAAVVCVLHGGETVFEVGLGRISMAEEPGAGRPATRDVSTVTRDTLFDLASLTKLFTTSAFLRLASLGRVDLDDRVATVIPEFAADGPRGMDGGQEPLSRRMLPTPPHHRDRRVDPVTVTFRHLVTHTSGLAPWRAIFRVTGDVPPPGGVDRDERQRRWTRGLEVVCDSLFVAEPGSEVLYSDLGFMLLGEAVSRLSGRPLADAVQERVLEPLELDSVTYLPLQAGRDRTSVAPTSLDDDWRHRRLWGEVEDENAAGLGGIAGHAGLFGTAGDVARFGQAWLSADPRLGIGPGLIAEATRDETPELGEARGLGWQVQPTDHLMPLGRRAYGHTGFTGTSLAVDSDRELVVALLTNRVHAGRTHPGIDELRVAVHEAAATMV